MSKIKKPAQKKTTITKPVDHIGQPELDILAPDKLRHMHMTAAGATFEKTMTQAEWIHAGVALRTAGVASAFALGDWLNFGAETFPKDYQEAMKQTGLAYGTLRNLASVCKRFPIEKRFANLSLEHHRLLAPIKDEKVLAHIAHETQEKGHSASAMKELLPKKPKTAPDPVKVANKKNQDMLQSGQDVLDYLNTLDAKYLAGWSTLLHRMKDMCALLCADAAAADLAAPKAVVGGTQPEGAPPKP